MNTKHQVQPISHDKGENMKTPEEYIERNIKTFLEKADKTKAFGTSYVQRTCGIGYNQAEYTIAEMLNRQLIILDDVKRWNYTFRQVDA